MKTSPILVCLLVAATGCRPQDDDVNQSISLTGVGGQVRADGHGKNGGKPVLVAGNLGFALERDGFPAENSQVLYDGRVSAGAEEKIEWKKVAGLRPSITFNGSTLDPSKGQDYVQKIDPRRDAVVTTWHQPGTGGIEVVTRSLRNGAFEFQFSLTPDRDGDLDIHASPSLPGGAEGFTMSAVVAEEPESTRSFSCSAGVTTLARITFLPGTAASIPPQTEPHDERRFILEGPEEDQIALESLAYQTRALIAPQAGGLSPFGLTDNRYYGHVFWDADAWLFPALALLEPEKAAWIPAYRLSTQRGAAQNYAAWLKAGRPIGNDQKMVGTEAPASPDILKFAWESSVSGLETAPGASRHQEHIGGTIARSMEGAAALDLAPTAETEKLARGVARYYLSRMEWGQSGLEMKGVMSPDEYHIGSNDLYTNMLASHLIQKYLDQSKPLRVTLPKDEKGQFLTYDEDRLKSYQQAAAVLAIYPLQNPEAEAQAISMLERFGPKVIEQGPAMSHSLHALIRARFGDADVAYNEWRASYDRYAKAPYGFISERPTTNQTVFVTGAAGFLNTVLYGFAGIRVAEKPWPDAEWKMPLRNGWWISGRGNLPAKWKSLTLTDLQILGKSYTLKVTHKTSTLIAN